MNTCNCTLWIVNPTACANCPNRLNTEISNITREIFNTWDKFNEENSDIGFQETLNKYFNTTSITEPTLPNRL